MLEHYTVAVVQPWTGLTDVQTLRLTKHIHWAQSYSERMHVMLPLFRARTWKDKDDFVPKFMRGIRGLVVETKYFDKNTKGLAEAVDWIASASEVCLAPDKLAASLNKDRVGEVHAELQIRGVDTHRIHVFPAWESKRRRVILHRKSRFA